MLMSDHNVTFFPNDMTGQNKTDINIHRSESTYDKVTNYGNQELLVIVRGYW